MSSDKEPLRTDQETEGQLPMPASAGFLVGLVPIAYLGYPFVGLGLGAILGALGFVISEYPERTREYATRAWTRVRAEE